MTPSALNLSRLAGILGLLAAAVGPLIHARADEPAPAPASPVSQPFARAFNASDLPQLAAQGIKIPRDGVYTVKVWAPARQVWTLTTDGAVWTLAARTEGTDPTPRWQVAGAAVIRAGDRVKIGVAGLLFEHGPGSFDIPKGKKQPEKPKPPPVPALLVLTTDPKLDTEPVLDLIRGRIETVDPPVDRRRAQVRTNQEGANFVPPPTVQAWRDRAAALRTQLQVTLGLWPMFPRTELKPQVFGKVERDGYTIEKVVLETFPGFTLSGNLYRPAGPGEGPGPGAAASDQDKRPGILCPHGHWGEGRTNVDVQQRCIRWAKLGCVVFLYDMVGYVDSMPFGHKFLDERLRHWGLSLVTLQTWNSIRALDWLSALPDVDPARIGCTGESGGGTQTFLLAALDPRVAVAAPVVMVSDTFQGGCVCENTAGLRIGTDNVEFAALIAPRPLKLVGASGDWTARTMTNAYPTLRAVYSLVGTTDRVSANVFDFPHNYNQTTRNAVYAFMANWLLGIDDPELTSEGEQSPEKAEDLRTYNDAHPAPSDLKTPAELEDALIALRRTQIAGLAPGHHRDPTAWESVRGALLNCLKVRVGLVNPTPSELVASEVRRVSREGLTVIHWFVGRRTAGEQIPVVRLVPAQPSGRLTIIVSPHGKAHLASADGRLDPLAEALLARGQSVVGFDPLLVGESLDPSRFAVQRPDTVHFETYNPSLAADQMQDLATVVAWARSQPDVRALSLVGTGRSGPQVLLARPVLEGLARTAVNLHEFDEGDGAAAYPPDIDLPGILQFGGLNAAAALCAPGPLRISRPGRSFDPHWPKHAYALAGSAQTLWLDDDEADSSGLARWIDSGE
jgi:dienelactone hydrolase